MTIAEVVKPTQPNPALKQAQQHTERAQQLRRQAQQQSARERVRKSQQSHSKALQQLQKVLALASPHTA